MTVSYVAQNCLQRHMVAWTVQHAWLTKSNAYDTESMMEISELSQETAPRPYSYIQRGHLVRVGIERAHLVSVGIHKEGTSSVLVYTERAPRPYWCRERGHLVRIGIYREGTSSLLV